MLVGLWAQAEIATGILVGCLPVTPRFVQYFGPKIYKTLSFISRSTQKSDKNSGSKDRTRKKKGLSFLKPASIKHTLGLNSFPETWAHPFSTKVRLDDDLVTLDEYNTTTSSTASERHGTKRDDLERGATDLV